MKVKIISPDATLLDEDCDFIVIPAAFGEMGILEDHEPTIAILKKGEIRITSGGTTKQFPVISGVAMIEHKSTTILIDKIVQE